jgi:hypothetical protein
MAKLTPTQEFLLKRAAEKDAEDAQDRGPGESRTPRVDMILDQHRNG